MRQIKKKTMRKNKKVKENVEGKIEKDRCEKYESRADKKDEDWIQKRER